MIHKFCVFTAALPVSIWLYEGFILLWPLNSLASQNLHMPSSGESGTDRQTAAAAAPDRTDQLLHTHHATCCRGSWTTQTKVIPPKLVHMFALLYLMHTLMHAQRSRYEREPRIRGNVKRGRCPFPPLPDAAAPPNAWKYKLRGDGRTFRGTRQVEAIYAVHISLFVVCNHANWTMREQLSVWANQESM